MFFRATKSKLKSVKSNRNYAIKTFVKNHNDSRCQFSTLAIDNRNQPHGRYLELQAKLPFSQVAACNATERSAPINLSKSMQQIRENLALIIEEFIHLLQQHGLDKATRQDIGDLHVYTCALVAVLFKDDDSVNINSSLINSWIYNTGAEGGHFLKQLFPSKQEHIGRVISALAHTYSNVDKTPEEIAEIRATLFGELAELVFKAAFNEQAKKGFFELYNTIHGVNADQSVLEQIEFGVISAVVAKIIKPGSSLLAKRDLKQVNYIIDCVESSLEKLGDVEKTPELISHLILQRVVQLRFVSEVIQPILYSENETENEAIAKAVAIYNNEATCDKAKKMIEDAFDQVGIELDPAKPGMGFSRE